MPNEFVFRFMSVRPSDTKNKILQADSKIDLYVGLKADTPLRAELAKVASSGELAASIRVVEQFRTTDRYVRSKTSLPLDVKPGLDWIQMHSDVLPTDAGLKTALEAAYGAPLSQQGTSPKLQDTMGRLADTILAETVRPSSPSLPLDQLTLAYKFFVFLFQLGSGATFAAKATVADLVGGRTLIIPSLGKLSPMRGDGSGPQQPTPVPTRGPVDTGPPTTELTLRDYEVAHRELADIAQSPTAVTLRATSEDAAARIASLEAQLEACHGASSGPVTDQGTRSARLVKTREAVRPVVAAATVSTLSDSTKRVLAALKVDTANVEPLTVVGSIERELNAQSSQLASSLAPQSMMMFAGTLIDRNAVRNSLGFGGGPPPPLPIHFCDFQAGIGDLLMVKQTLKAYELAEFAHVENVLAGETRDREHRRLDTSEDITTTEQTTETQKEKDLQSTQRSEMQNEADKTVKQQFGLDAGLQISGSYGPSVQFATHLNANFSTTSEETQRKTIAFSQEITEKTSESIRQTIKQTVSHRVLQEIQEINKHSFVNTSMDKHIRGIYRWLNKVYDAQIFNYGQRMMYEFVVPEPAAYFLYAMVENPPKDLDLVKPLPPTYLGQPLKPDNLTRANYTNYVAQYQVSGVPAPPPEFQTASYFDKQDSADENSYGRAGKVDVPDGYEAYAAVVMSDFSFTQGHDHAFDVMLGNRSFDQTGFWGAAFQYIDPRRREMSIAYQLFQVKSFTLGVDVLTRVTAEAMSKWQQSVYDSIIQTYQKQKADYDEKMAEKKLESDPMQLGRNPLENQRITKDELRKLVLMILTGSDDIARDSFYSSDEPLMDLSKVCPNGSWIRFFENAFEWTNLIYVLYPYFWGRHARWNSAIHFTDPDSEFAAFLRAGAARVQVPVRPGFERAVAYFCQYGLVWEGNDPPLRDDDLYVPIVDEIAANLGKFDNDGVPYPEGSGPWEVRIPTELVLVENLEEVPNIRDILTGKDVTIHG